MARANRKRSRAHPLALALGVPVALASIAVAVAGVVLWVYASDPALPRMSSARDYHPPMVTRVLDRHDRVLGEIYRERRTVVPLTRIPLSRRTSRIPSNSRATVNVGRA